MIMNEIVDNVISRQKQNRKITLNCDGDDFTVITDFQYNLIIRQTINIINVIGVTE